DDQQSLDPVEILFNGLQNRFVAETIYGIAARYAMHVSIGYLRVTDQPRASDLLGRQRYQCIGFLLPDWIVIVPPVFKRKNTATSRAIELRNPVPEICDSAHRQFRRVHIEPLILEEIGRLNI